MGRFSNVLLASDFDHTLTDMSGQIPARNLEAIAAFQAEGGIFTVASGRSIPMFRKKAALVPVNAPCILYNGGACYDYRTDELLFAFPLADDAPQLLQALRDHCPNERTEVQTLDCHYAYGDDPRRDAALGCQRACRYSTKLSCRRSHGSSWPSMARRSRWAMTTRPTPRRRRSPILTSCSATRPGSSAIAMPSPARCRAIWRSARAAATRALPPAVWPTRSAAAFLSASATHPNDLAMLQAADYGFRTGDCDPAMRRYDFRDAAPSAEGSVASVIDALSTLL